MLSSADSEFVKSCCFTYWGSTATFLAYFNLKHSSSIPWSLYTHYNFIFFETADSDCSGPLNLILDVPTIFYNEMYLPQFFIAKTLHLIQYLWFTKCAKNPQQQYTGFHKFPFNFTSKTNLNKSFKLYTIDAGSYQSIYFIKFDIIFFWKTCVWMLKFRHPCMQPLSDEVCC
jgi:hypothetical protein